MNLPEISVKRWQLTLVVFLALIALGIQALRGIPKAEDPTFPMAAFGIAAVLPGATPQDMERQVVDPIERELYALEAVKDLKSHIQDGVAVVEIEFIAGSDPNRKRDDVLREVNQLRPELPKELVRLDVEQFNTASVNIAELALISELPYAELEPIVSRLKRRLQSVSGVGEATVAGLPDQEIRVALDLSRMSAIGIPVNEVYASISAEAQQLPAGSVDAGARRFNVRTSGDYASVEEIQNTVVRSVAGRVVLLRDIAEVALVDEEPSHIARFNGKRAVLVAVNQREGENVFRVQARLDQEISRFQSTLPAGVRLERGLVQANNVERRMSGLGRDFLLAIALVLITLLPLGIRASLVVMVSIPLSLAMGVFGLYMTGHTMNQLSIVGFVIALGLLVDDSVVVVENIERFLRAGYSPVRAAIQATRQISISVLGCTATLALAFVPLLALPGASGQFIRDLPMAVVFTVAASLLVSLTIVPFLSSRLLVNPGEHGNIFFRAMIWAIEGTYRRVLSRAVAHPWLTVAGAAGLLVGSLALIPSIGFSLFPKAGVPEVLIRIQGAEGDSLAQTNRAALHVESVLAQHPDIVRIAATVGKGHPMVYYNTGQRNEKANVADVFAELTVHDPPEIARVMDELRERLAGFPGARIEVVEFENGPPVEAPVALRLLGNDSEALESAAHAVERALATLPGLRDIRNPSRDQRTDLRVRIDRERAAVLGVGTADIDRAVRLGLGGIHVAEYRPDGRDQALSIRITLPRTVSQALPNPVGGGDRPSLAVLEQIRVPTAAGPTVPLAQVAEIGLEPSPAEIRHHKKERSTTVTAQVARGFNTSRLTEMALTKVAALTLPDGVRLEIGGEEESRQETFGGLGTAILVACFGVLAVLVLEFRTFKSTLIVASVIPLGVVGGLVALWLTGNTLSFTATIGFIALTGIEVKSSILLVDFTNQLRSQGMALDDAIRRAGETRFVPILLTTLTAIGGLVPLILEGSALYTPLAWVILGGLVSSTVLTRLVTPVLYKLLAPTLESEASSPNSDPSLDRDPLLPANA